MTGGTAHDSVAVQGRTAYLNVQHSTLTEGGMDLSLEDGLVSLPDGSERWLVTSGLDVTEVVAARRHGDWVANVVGTCGSCGDRAKVWIRVGPGGHSDVSDTECQGCGSIIEALTVTTAETREHARNDAVQWIVYGL